MKLKINKENLTSLALSIAIVSAFIAGLIFVLVADIKLNVASQWLFVSIFLPILGGILFLLGDMRKEKVVLSIILKVIGLILVAGYIVFLAIASGSGNIFPTGSRYVTTIRVMCGFCYALSVISIIAGIYNLVVATLTSIKDNKLMEKGMNSNN